MSENWATWMLVMFYVVAGIFGLLACLVPVFVWLIHNDVAEIQKLLGPFTSQFADMSWHVSEIGQQLDEIHERIAGEEPSEEILQARALWRSAAADYWSARAGRSPTPGIESNEQAR